MTTVNFSPDIIRQILPCNDNKTPPVFGSIVDDNRTEVAVRCYRFADQMIDIGYSPELVCTELLRVIGEIAYAKRSTDELVDWMKDYVAYYENYQFPDDEFH